jgi:hypothetical protein
MNGSFNELNRFEHSRALTFYWVRFIELVLNHTDEPTRWSYAHPIFNNAHSACRVCTIG